VVYGLRVTGCRLRVTGYGLQYIKSVDYYSVVSFHFMYQTIIRPFLFLFPPEKVHGFVACCLRLLFAVPLMAAIVRKLYTFRHPSLEREVFGIRFPNPVGIAAGFDKEARLYNLLGNFGFGHVEIGTVTPLPQAGNPRPRLFRLPKDHALINRMGFNNHGVRAIVKNLLNDRPSVIIGGNIGKNTLTPNEDAIADYCICFEDMFDHVDYFVVNVSCPNIAGLSKLQDKDELLALLHAIQAVNQAKPRPKPVLLKISPDLTDKQLDEVIEIVEDTSISGLIATNTSARREGLTTSIEKIDAIGSGGLSGKPLQRKSTRTISYLFEKSGGKIPIVAVGGIFTADDAIEKLRAGATLVQVYTGFVYEGPGIARRINKKIAGAVSSTHQSDVA
jgi:dihydroorotate dehydrogenase